MDILSSEDLKLIYDVSGPKTIDIGHLSQDPSIGGYFDVDEMLHKHFAVLGTTGVGKSSGVALILREILRARPNQRIFLIDPHNEYGACFGERANVLTPANLRLPYWLFNFEEMVDVVFRARPGVDAEVEVLGTAITEAKNRFAGEKESLRLRLRKSGSDGPGYTVDTPVPYRMADVISIVDERMGKLENKSTLPIYSRLLTRIETVTNDPRYRFMFHNANVGGDTMVGVLSELFNLPDNTGPVTVMQLVGFPAEVVNSVVSVLCRMAFELGLWSGSALPILMVCEEAHRYAPADKTIGFRPDEESDLPNRQGRPQIQCLSRPDHPATCRTGCYHRLPVQHAVRHAYGERPRPRYCPLGRLGCGRRIARLCASIGDPRSIRIRRELHCPPDFGLASYLRNCCHEAAPPARTTQSPAAASTQQ